MPGKKDPVIWLYFPILKKILCFKKTKDSKICKPIITG